MLDSLHMTICRDCFWFREYYVLFYCLYLWTDKWLELTKLKIIIIIINYYSFIIIIIILIIKTTLFLGFGKKKQKQQAHKMTLLSSENWLLWHFLMWQLQHFWLLGLFRPIPRLNILVIYHQYLSYIILITSIGVYL